MEYSENNLPPIISPSFTDTSHEPIVNYENNFFLPPEGQMALNWLMYDLRFSFEFTEIMRRLRNLAWQIFNAKMFMNFNAENLINITRYITPEWQKNFAFENNLKEEAFFIIPIPPAYEFDIQVFIPHFRTALLNKNRLRCFLLPIGLFMLFFNVVMKNTPCNQNVSWTTLVNKVFELTFQGGQS